MLSFNNNILENDSLKKALIQTVGFFSLNNYPLSLFEIKKYLSYPKISKKKLLFQIKNYDEITILTDQETKKNYYTLQNSNSSIETRKEKIRIKLKLLEKTKKYIKFLQFIPYIRMISVCNNIALGVPDKNSDIDLFIVTAKNRLFTGRLLITLLLHIFGVRRHDNKIKHRFCLSFFVSEDGLNLSSIALKPKDIYLAYWTRSLTPIFDQNIYTKLLIENSEFLNDYFKTDYKNLKHIINQGKFSKSVKKILEFTLNGFIGEFIENKLKNWQLKRSNNKKSQIEDNSGIVISEKMLKFHNIDRRKDINAKLHETVILS